MRTRSIGNDTVGHVQVGAIGLGLMPFDHNGPQPREQLLDTIRAALDAGVTLFDTADAYGPEKDGVGAQGQNERLVASLLDELGVRDRILLATKGGQVRTENGGWAPDSSAEHLRGAVDASLSRLGIDRIELWQHHRPDPSVDYADLVGTLREIVDSGKVARIGLSNADPGQIRHAHAVLGDALVSVQNQFNPAFRSSAREIAVCDELGLTFMAWSPLGRLSAGDLAARYPAFSAIAQHRQVSVQQVVLAWELAQSPVVIPIPGAKRPQSITDSAAAAILELSSDELSSLDAGRP